MWESVDSSTNVESSFARVSNDVKAIFKIYRMCKIAFYALHCIEN